MLSGGAQFEDPHLYKYSTSLPMRPALPTLLFGQASFSASLFVRPAFSFGQPVYLTSPLNRPAFLFVCPLFLSSPSLYLALLLVYRLFSSGLAERRGHPTFSSIHSINFHFLRIYLISLPGTRIVLQSKRIFVELSYCHFPFAELNYPS